MLNIFTRLVYLKLLPCGPLQGPQVVANLQAKVNISHTRAYRALVDKYLPLLLLGRPAQ